MLTLASSNGTIVEIEHRVWSYITDQLCIKVETFPEAPITPLSNINSQISLASTVRHLQSWKPRPSHVTMSSNYIKNVAIVGVSTLPPPSPISPPPGSQPARPPATAAPSSHAPFLTQANTPSPPSPAHIAPASSQTASQSKQSITPTPQPSSQPFKAKMPSSSLSAGWSPRTRRRS